MYNYAAVWQINFMSKMCTFQDQNLKFAKISATVEVHTYCK